MFQINVRDYGARGDGHTDDTDAFERALAHIYEHNQLPSRNFAYGGELFIPNGIYVLNRGLRGPANFIQTSYIDRRPRLPPGSPPRPPIPQIAVAGRDDNYDRFRLVIESDGGLGTATFRWSRNYGRNWEERGITIPTGGTYTLGSTKITVTLIT